MDMKLVDVDRATAAVDAHVNRCAGLPGKQVDMTLLGC